MIEKLCSHNRLPTKRYLHHIGMNIDTICSICKGAEEIITHIFFECPIAQIFWNKVHRDILLLNFNAAH